MVTEWSDGELGQVLEACERMSNHLTAAVVSNDINFVQHVLANTVNGTTYVGIRARTTGGCGTRVLRHMNIYERSRAQLVTV